MCGIVGGLRLKTKASKITTEEQNIIMKIFGTELLLLTEERGEDATGAALIFKDGSIRGMKHGKSATDIVLDFDEESKTNYMALMDIWDGYKEPVNIFMGHCRKKTIGDPRDNRNNHPFKVGNLIGIHNGNIENHYRAEKALEEIEKIEIDREGTVDSEIIFHMLAHAVKDNKNDIFTLENAEWVVKRLYGKFAVLAANINNPYQLLAFRDNKPIEVIFSRKAGLIFIASDRKFLDAANSRYDRFRRYYLDRMRKQFPEIVELPKLNFTVSTMNDDHAWLFNLDKVVDEDTKLADIVETKAMPRLGARKAEWKSGYTPPRTHTPTTPRTPATGSPAASQQQSEQEKANARRRMHGGLAKPDPSKEDKGNGAGDDDEVPGVWREGHRWNADSRTFEPGSSKVIDMEPDKDDNNTYVPITTGRNNSATGSTGSASEVLPNGVEEDSEEDENVVSGVAVNDFSDYSYNARKREEERKRSRVSSRSVPEDEIVDDKKHLDIDNKVRVYKARRGWFSNVQEALEIIGVEDEGDIGNMEFRNVANKIRAEACAVGFRDGYEQAAEDFKSKSGYTTEAMKKAIKAERNKSKQKKKRAEKKIKTLKALVLYLAASLPEDEILDEDFIKEANNALKELNYSLDIKQVNRIFSMFEKKQINFFTTSADSGDDE